MIRSGKQTGYILLPVIVVITLVAAIALLMNTESALESNIAGSELDARRVQYVAQAGLNHALWTAQQQGCGPYGDLLDEPLGNHKYTTTLITDLGSTSAYTINVDQDSMISSELPTINYATGQRLHTRNQVIGIERPLLRYDLSPIAAKASILSATAWFYINFAHAGGAIDIHLTSADWTETDATWDSMSTNMDGAVLATIPSQPVNNIWIQVNLTAQVQAWVNGQPNFGITLNSTVDGVHAQYSSRESANPPYLEVVVGTPPTSPAMLKAVGTLANGVTRDFTRTDITLLQHPAGFSLSKVTAGFGQDAMINSFYDSRDYGDHELQVSIGSGSTIERSLIQFALPAIPPRARIISARLELYHYVTTGTPVGAAIDVHRLTRNWVEGTHGGTGAADGATWYTWDGNNWWSGGGNYDATPVASSSISAATGDWESWEIGELMQGWIDGRFPNHGLILGGTGILDVSFASKEDVDPSLHPKLSITYTCACGEVCLTPQGSGNLLMVVINPTTLVAEDQQANDLFESWGYTVSIIGESENQTVYDAAIAANDVVFISETVNNNAVGTKLADAPIGVVSQDGDYNGDLGFSSSTAWTVGAAINVTDTDHYITAPFAAGPLGIYANGMEQLTVNGSEAAGLQTLADSSGKGSLVVLDTGATIDSGSAAAGRRVMLPLGTRYRFNWDYLNANGRLIVQRALTWGAGLDAFKPSTKVLFVVPDTTALGPQDTVKKTLMESWGFSVTLITAADSQANFDAASMSVDVAYVSEEVLSSDLNTKLRNVSIGVVIEETALTDEFGVSSTRTGYSGTDIEVVDTTHYITSTFALGPLAIATSATGLDRPGGTLAPGLDTLAQSGGNPELATIETGGQLYDSGTAAGRRVKMPWGTDAFDINLLTADGETLMRRAIEWGAGAGAEEVPAGYLDEFNNQSCDPAADYSGSDGTLDWSPWLWTEINESDGSCAGQIQVAEDPVIPDPGSFRLRVIGEGPRVYRSVDLSGLSQPILSFDYRLVNYPSGDFMRVRISTNGGTDWTEVVRYTGPFDHTEYQSASFDLSAFITADTLIQFSFDGASTTRTSYIDNVRINQFDAAASGPIAHWKLDDAVGSTAIDSATTNDGTLNGSPAWVGGALDFDGNNDYVDVGTFDVSGNGITMMGWFNAEVLATDDGRIVSKANGANEADAWWQLSSTDSGSDRYLRMRIKAGGTTTTMAAPSVNLSTGQWYFAVGTYDNASGQMKLYLDGVEVANGAHAVGGALDTNPSVPVALGANGTAERFFNGILDDVRVYDYALSSTTIAELFAEGGNSPYTELYQPWSATSDDTWQTVDLAPFGVPANAVVEVAVVNSDFGKEFFGGVRAVGSSLERRFALHEAEGGGVDAVTMHVQADAGSQIQHYSDRATRVSFILLGYWTGAVYVELFDNFSVTTANSWIAENLADNGVGADMIAEIALVNTNANNEYLAGLRRSGSSLLRYFNLREPESGGVDVVSLMVETDATAAIEVFAQSSSDINFQVLGYWSTPPGNYTEADANSGQVGVAAAWQPTDLSGYGVPAGATAQFVLANVAAAAHAPVGLRASGSVFGRLIDLQEAESGGSDLASMHVNVNSSTEADWYVESGITERLFYPVGWWVLSP